MSAHKTEDLDSTLFIQGTLLLDLPGWRSGGNHRAASDRLGLLTALC